MKLPLRRTLLCSVFAALLPQSIPGETQIDAHTFSLPAGFTIQRVAASPLVDRPIVADFDEAGRLYVADSSGSNNPVEKQLAEKPHRIVRLEDVDGDGVFDKSIVFADKMMFPAGAMWLKDSLYVSAPPSIWKLTDTDGDGVADQRREWFQGKTLTGCANDLHGPYLGPDGWIYWCKGAFAKQTHERPGGEPFTTRAAHIFRARPDGTGLEAVMTGGMDNPVDVVFTPEGERIFTTTFFQHPGGGQRDGLVHAIYGGVYGKAHDVLDDHPRTGELMPVLTHLGPAAPSGLARFESEHFGDAYRNNLFAANFNLRKVSRHMLIPEESGYRTENSDFLVSNNSDFHPTDVIEDADGSLLIIDTGGWYKLCCPTSQLWKPDVLGAIYRVRKEGGVKVNDPRGLKIDWNNISPGDLITLLGDKTRPAVQKRAVNRLATSSAETVTAGFEKLEHPEIDSSEARRNAVWALARLESEEAGRLVSSALRDEDPSVVHAAIHVASVTRTHQALHGLIELLQSEYAPLKRAAAEALGRLGEIKAVHPLLDAAGRLHREGQEVQDRNLEHSILYALIEINSPQATRAGYLSSNALVVRAAAIALDQMKAGDYTAPEALDLLSSGNPFLKKTGSWIISQHQDWGASLAEYYGRRLANPGLSDAERKELQRQLVNSISANEVQELLGRAITNKSLPLLNRSLALQAIAHSALKTIPASWASGLDTLITERDSELLPESIRAISSIDPKQLPAGVRRQLEGISRNGGLNSEVRLEALASASPDGPLGEDLFEFFYSNLVAASPAIGKILSQFAFSEEQLLQLTNPVRSAGPLQISSLLAPFAQSKSERVGIALVKALTVSKGLSGLHSDRLKQLFASYPEGVQAEAAGLIESLNEDADAQSAHLNEMVEKLQEGDVRRGQALFNSSKTACSSCHAIGYLGGDLGPDLTRIGQVRNERDLLEAVLFPSASFVRSYEPIIVSTRDGEEYSGIMRKNAPDEIVLATGPNVEVRIAAADVLGMRPGKVSVMPQGLDQQLSTSELADLIAFLKATRW